MVIKTGRSLWFFSFLFLFSRHRKGFRHCGWFEGKIGATDTGFVPREKLFSGLTARAEQQAEKNGNRAENVVRKMAVGR
jgi:hypothetical protein